MKEDDPTEGLSPYPMIALLFQSSTWPWDFEPASHWKLKLPHRHPEPHHPAPDIVANTIHGHNHWWEVIVTNFTTLSACFLCDQFAPPDEQVPPGPQPESWDVWVGVDNNIHYLRFSIILKILKTPEIFGNKLRPPSFQGDQDGHHRSSPLHNLERNW